MPAPRLAIDTNLLFYAINVDSPFHSGAVRFFESIEDDDSVALSELVLAELYCLLRNPRVNKQPLSAEKAVALIETYRRHPYWLLVGFPTSQRRLHDQLWKVAGGAQFAFRRIYDARLALSLLHQGVTEFATANTKDFRGLGFRKVWNPLEE